MHGEVVERQTAGERGGDSRVLDDLGDLEGEVRGEENDDRLRDCRGESHVLQDQRADQRDDNSNELEWRRRREPTVEPMVMPIMSRPAMRSVVKDMGESSNLEKVLYMTIETASLIVDSP